MMPALDTARRDAAGRREPWHFFWGRLHASFSTTPRPTSPSSLGQGQRLAADVVGIPHDILQTISLRGVHGREHLHRQRPELHGPLMPRAAHRCRALWSCSTAAVLIPVFLIVTVMFFS
jgi:hypothetical protein